MTRMARLRPTTRPFSMQLQALLGGGLRPPGSGSMQTQGSAPGGGSISGTGTFILPSTPLSWSEDMVLTQLSRSYA